MQAIPGVASIDLDGDEEQVVALQPYQQLRRVLFRFRITGECRAQGRAEVVADGHELQQLDVGRRKVRQHLRFEEVLECLDIAQPGSRRVLVRAPLGVRPALAVADGEQLQAGGPAIGLLVHPLRILHVDSAQLHVQELRRLLGGELQVARAQLQYQILAA
ncbi:hypothetical protein D3C78_579410 [compost metagenome]